MSYLKLNLLCTYKHEEVEGKHNVLDDLSAASQTHTEDKDMKSWYGISKAVNFQSFILLFSYTMSLLLYSFNCVNTMRLIT